MYNLIKSTASLNRLSFLRSTKQKKHALWSLIAKCLKMTVEEEQHIIFVMGLQPKNFLPGVAPLPMKKVNKDGLVFIHSMLLS